MLKNTNKKTFELIESAALIILLDYLRRILLISLSIITRG